MDKEENVTAFSELNPGALDGCATNNSNFSTTFVVNCKTVGGHQIKVVYPLATSKTEWKPNHQHTGLLFQNIIE